MGACQSTNKNNNVPITTKMNRPAKNPDESHSKYESKNTKLEDLESVKPKPANTDPIKNLPNVKKEDKIEKDSKLPDGKNSKEEPQNTPEEPIGVLNGKNEMKVKKENSEDNKRNDEATVKEGDSEKAEKINKTEKSIIEEKKSQNEKNEGNPEAHVNATKIEVNRNNQQNQPIEQQSDQIDSKQDLKLSRISVKAGKPEEINGNIEQDDITGEIEEIQEESQMNNEIIDLDQNFTNTKNEISMVADVSNLQATRRSDFFTNKNEINNSILNGKMSAKNLNSNDERDIYSQYKPAHLNNSVLKELNNGIQYDSLEKDNGVSITNNAFTLADGNQINIQDDSVLDPSDSKADIVNPLKLSIIQESDPIKYESYDVRGEDTLRTNIREKSRGITVKPNIPDMRQKKNSDIITPTEAELSIFDLFLNINSKTPLDPNYELKKLIINELSLEHFNSLIKAHSNCLIYYLIPFIVDNFRRRLDLKGIKEIFSKFNKLNKNAIKVSNLSQRNVIEILLHVISVDSRMVIGKMLQNFNYYLPLTYWKLNFEKKNFEYQLEFPLIHNMINVEKPIFFNLGLTNTIGKTEILADLFNFDKSNMNISNQSGLNREGTIDLYNRNDFSIFDLNHFSLKENVLKVCKEILKISSAVFIHFDYPTLKREVKSDKFKKLEELLDSKKRIVVFIRNYDEDEKDEIDKIYLQKFFKNKIELFDIFLVKDLSKINSEEKETEITDIREKFKKGLPELKEQKKIFNAFYFEDILTENKFSRHKDFEYVENKLIIFNKTEDPKSSPFSKLLKFSYEKYKIEKMEKQKLPTNHSALKKIDITQTFLHVFNDFLIRNDRNKLYALDSYLEKMSDTYLKPLIESRKKKLESLLGINAILPSLSASLQKEIAILNEEIENNNITFDHFYADLFYFYDFYHSMEYERENLNEMFDKIKKAYIREVSDGYPIHIIKNNHVSIHHQFLEEIFGDEYFRDKKYFVISILGMQSSAKSTLLNYLFGTDFKVSSGRCTRGIYASLIQTDNKKENIILLDTEGLSSIEGNDKLFDHQMALMCFGLSHLVLVNHKGELSKNLQELLEISLYAMNYMSILNKSNPKIFFVLRDQIEREGDKHNAALAKAKLQLQEIANKQNINLEDVMKIDLENLILLPSAFKENTENGINIITPSNTFSKEVLKLRKKIFGEYEIIKTANKLSNLHNFYNHACNLWTSFNKYGIDLLSCDSLREYEQKLEINDEIKKLVDAENKKLTKDINLYLETSYDSIKSLSKLVDDQYEIYITNVYNESIKWIINEIEERFKNKRQFPQKIIDEGFDTIKDNMNLLKKHMLYFWKTKFIYLNRDIQTKQLQNEIKNRIEKEIERIVEYCEEEKEVLDNLSNVTGEYKKKLIENIPLPILDDIKKSCFQTFNYSVKFPFPKIKFSELDEIDKINKKNWLHFSFADNLTNTIAKSINPREITDMEAEKQNVLNEFDEFLKNLFLNFDKTEVMSDDKVSFYCTQIENFLKTDNSKHNFDRFNKDILYKDLSLIFIQRMSEILYENQNKKYIREINFITENISNIYKDSIDLFNTRKDDLQFTEKLAESYLVDLFNNIRLIHSAQIISIVEKEFEDLPKDPEDFIRYAYEISFNRKNAVNVYKFVMDINKFLLDIFYDLVKNKKDNILNIFKDKFETDLINKRKKFEVLINLFQLDYKKKGVEKFILKEFNNTISNSPDLSDLITPKNIYDKMENNLNDFCQIFLSAVRNFYSDKTQAKTMLESTFVEIETRMNQFLEDKRNLIIGCQHVCPFCNSKCSKPAGEHSNHQAIHVINGFGGCKCVDNNEAILEYCLSKANMERKWRNPRDPSQFHKGIVEVCEFHFPDWVEDFQTNSKILSKDEEDKQMHCWYYVRKPICHYYGMKDHTNPNYLLDPNNLLPENFGQNY